MSVVSDPIGDMLVRIKNGYRARKALVVVPHSGLKEQIAKILEARGFLSAMEKKGKRARKFLELTLSYRDGVPSLHEAKRVSKPSRRIYRKAKEIRPVKYGRGVAILSTPAGMMTGDEARKRGLGGEMIAEVW